jgi:hypothetical protein
VAGANPSISEAEHIGRQLPDEPLCLWLRWDGLMMSEHLSEQAFKINVNELDDPAACFESVRTAAAKRV